MARARAWRWVASQIVIGLATACVAEPRVLSPSEIALEFDRRVWQREDGLPDNRVWAICQTRDGYIWLGTQRGLARFDGLRFTVFNHLNTPELVDDDCRTLVEDRDGDLWIGTGKGLVRKRGRQFTRFEAKHGLPPSVADWPPLCASRSGGIWAGGDSCICRIRGDDVKRILHQNGPLELGEVAVLDEDESGDLWVGTSYGLMRFDAKQQQFEWGGADVELERRPVFGLAAGPGGKRWVLFAEYIPKPSEPDPKLWLGFIVEGRWTSIPGTQGSHFSTAVGGRFLLGTGDGTVWLPASKGAIHRYRNGEDQRMPTVGQRSEGGVSSACLDREGNLWVGTTETGLERWTPRRIRTYTVEDGLVHDEAWSICEAPDRSVWIGTEGGISQLRDGRFQNFPMPPVAPESSVRSVVEDQAGTIWFGTIRAVHRIEEERISQLTLPGDWTESKIRVLHPARDGALWIGSVRGLTRLKDGERTKYTSADGFGSEEVRAILESKNGDLWIGTFGSGLSRLHQGRFTTLSTTNGLSNNNVWALCEDSDGVIWAGTESGLNRIENGHVRVFKCVDGLPDDAVTCVIEDDHGRLWFGHDQGIYWVDRQQFKEVSSGTRRLLEPVRYGTSDGLISIEVTGRTSNPTVCKTRDGRLWFPTPRGVAVIDPSVAALDKVAPFPRIEEVRANGKLVAWDGPLNNLDGSLSEVNAISRTVDRLRLPPGGARVLEFRFTANSFVNPEKARFKYRLVGLADHWIEIGARRELHLTDLRPGDYRLELSACNSHGVWQQNAAAFAFSVAPFFYKTWKFVGGCALALLALVAGWRAHELRKILRLERAKVLARQREQIARDIHDELGASLTRILQLSGDARANQVNPDQFQQRADRIAALASEAVDSIGSIVWANNPEYDTLEDLVAYIREYAANAFAETAIEVRLNFPKSVSPWRVTGLFRRNMVLVVKEGLQNVWKHAGASRVELRLCINDKALGLELGDNGRGFPAQAGKTNGNGLANMRQRVLELNGDLQITSAPGQGTLFRISVPLES